ncbi:hypothetical protein [Streptomyces sp. MP131-18]|uniref:hypothetical protein n=1 Tax=Streptomyces sp. MP131-18 TaxID=1857892 RepID=UPI00097C76CF|nr:hypothetical protein [Streptomyces sp. MP131-18]ONK09229.1 hypothetical protein STBA_71660 [Streptomyces sp. MP131-18]
MITKIPVPYIVRATSRDHGVDVIVLPGAQQAPEYWNCNQFTLALHQDGSHCDNDCGCMAAADADMTTLTNGETLVIGEWTWQGARSWAVGWRRNGPNAAETKLLKRVAELEERVEFGEEALADERELHRDAKQHMNDDARLIEGLRGELGEAEVERRALEASVRQLNGQLYPLVRELPWLRWGAAIGWGLALVLAAALVWAVIA